MPLKSSAYPAGAFLLLSALPIASQAVAVVPNFGISGIPSPGFPHFDNTKDVSITLTKTGTTYQLAANYTAGPFLFQYDPWTSFNVTDGAFQLVANFDSGGVFNPTGSSVQITGTIPGYSVPGTTPPTSSLLYSADLVGFGSDISANATPMALGFKTDNWAGWAEQFQVVPESVYLYDFNAAAFMSSFNSPKFKTITFTKASALTTVPLPAAVWLFGSALAILSGVRRRTPVSSG